MCLAAFSMPTLIRFRRLKTSGYQENGWPSGFLKQMWRTERCWVLKRLGSITWCWTQWFWVSLIVERHSDNLQFTDVRVTRFVFKSWLQCCGKEYRSILLFSPSFFCPLPPSHLHSFSQDVPKDYRHMSLTGVEQRFEDEAYHQISKERVSVCMHSSCFPACLLLVSSI